MLSVTHGTASKGGFDSGAKGPLQRKDWENSCSWEIVRKQKYSWRFCGETCYVLKRPVLSQVNSRGPWGVCVSKRGITKTATFCCEKQKLKLRGLLQLP